MITFVRLLEPWRLPQSHGDMPYGHRIVEAAW
jgi:hypothetical protein